MTPYEFTEINREYGFQAMFNSKLKAVLKEEYEKAVKNIKDAFYAKSVNLVLATENFKTNLDFLSGLVNEHFEEKQETNFEHYKDGIIEVCVDELAISKGKVVECCAIPCSECDFEDKNGHCIGNHEIMKWLKQPYKKLPYKLSQWEYDLLNAHKDSGMQKCLSNYRPLLELNEKGYFKGIDTSTPIHEILDNCKVV